MWREYKMKIVYDYHSIFDLYYSSDAMDNFSLFSFLDDQKMTIQSVE